VPRAIPIKILQARSEAVLSRLERAGVTDEGLLGDCLDILLAELPPPQQKDGQRVARPLPSPATLKMWFDRIERRLDQCDDLLHVYPPAAFAQLCAIILPERYADPPLAKAPTPHPPGSVGKRQAMTDRVHKGKQPFHDADADDLPDAVAFQPAKHSGRLGRVRERDDADGQRHLNDVELPIVVVQGPKPAPQGPLTLEGCLDVPSNYDPATELIRAKGDFTGGEAKHAFSTYSRHSAVGDDDGTGGGDD
jgi:hypothetical protein